MSEIDVLQSGLNDSARKLLVAAAHFSAAAIASCAENDADAPVPVLPYSVRVDNILSATPVVTLCAEIKGSEIVIARVDLRLPSASKH